MSGKPLVPEKLPGPLAEARAHVLSLPAEEALDAILDHPRSGDLVRSMPAQDLHLLVHEIGPQDAVPLLQMATGEQWGCLVDMDVWERDLLNFPAISQWLELLFSADPARMVQWFMRERTEIFESWLFSVLSFHLLDEHDDPSDLGDGAFTMDGTLYVRLRAGAEAEAGQQDLLVFVRRLLKVMASLDFSFYQGFLLETSGLILAEAQEEAFRLRSVALAEKGFLPFEEAVGIYQPLAPEALLRKGPKAWPSREGQNNETASNLIPPGHPFSEALALAGGPDQVQRLQAEFAALCNQLIVADLVKVRSREDLRPVVEKACGYVDMGLQELSGVSGRSTQALIASHALSDIFRVGYALAMRLKFKAARWREGAWFSRRGLPLSFWGESWLGVLGGILLQKPRCFDNYKAGRLYREFANREEIRQAEETLERIMAMDAFLETLPLAGEWFSLPWLTFKILILSLWAKNLLNLPPEAAPMDPDQAREFFFRLWENGTKPFRAGLAAKQAFLEFLAQASGQSPARIAQGIGRTLEDLFAELEAEYGALSLEDLDPRYIPHLYLKQPG